PAARLTREDEVIALRIVSTQRQFQPALPCQRPVTRPTVAPDARQNGDDLVAKRVHRRSGDGGSSTKNEDECEKRARHGLYSSTMNIKTSRWVYPGGTHGGDEPRRSVAQDVTSSRPFRLASRHPWPLRQPSGATRLCFAELSASRRPW